MANKTTSKKAPALSASETQVLQRLAKRLAKKTIPPSKINWQKLPAPQKRLMSGNCPFAEHWGASGICTQCEYCFNFTYCQACNLCQTCQRKKRALFNVYKLRADQFAGHYEILLLAEALGWPDVWTSDSQKFKMPAYKETEWRRTFEQLIVPAKHYVYRALIARRDGTRVQVKGKKR